MIAGTGAKLDLGLETFEAQDNRLCTNPGFRRGTLRPRHDAGSSPVHQ